MDLCRNIKFCDPETALPANIDSAHMSTKVSHSYISVACKMIIDESCD